MPAKTCARLEAYPTNRHSGGNGIVTTGGSSGLDAFINRPQTPAMANATEQVPKAAPQPKDRDTHPRSTGEKAAPARFPHILPQPKTVPTFRPPTSWLNAQIAGTPKSTNKVTKDRAITTDQAVVKNGITLKASAPNKSAPPIGADRHHRGPRGARNQSVRNPPTSMPTHPTRSGTVCIHPCSARGT